MFNEFLDENISDLKSEFLIPSVVNDLIEKNNLQGIVIPSMRTPKNIIELSKKHSASEIVKVIC